MAGVTLFGGGFRQVEQQLKQKNPIDTCPRGLGKPLGMFCHPVVADSNVKFGRSGSWPDAAINHSEALWLEMCDCDASSEGMVKGDQK